MIFNNILSQHPGIEPKQGHSRSVSYGIEHKFHLCMVPYQSVFILYIRSTTYFSKHQFKTF